MCSFGGVISCNYRSLKGFVRDLYRMICLYLGSHRALQSFFRGFVGSAGEFWGLRPEGAFEERAPVIGTPSSGFRV